MIYIYYLFIFIPTLRRDEDFLSGLHYKVKNQNRANYSKNISDSLGGFFVYLVIFIVIYVRNYTQESNSGTFNRKPDHRRLVGSYIWDRKFNFPNAPKVILGYSMQFSRRDPLLRIYWIKLKLAQHPE